jgi:hypothetical protein
MGRIRKGSIVERKGKIYACVQFIDEAEISVVSGGKQITVNRGAIQSKESSASWIRTKRQQ